MHRYYPKWREYAKIWRYNLGLRGYCPECGNTIRDPGILSEMWKYYPRFTEYYPNARNTI